MVLPSRRGAVKAWRAKADAAGAVSLVLTAMKLWPSRLKVQLHGCNFLGTYVSGLQVDAGTPNYDSELIVECVGFVANTLSGFKVSACHSLLGCFAINSMLLVPDCVAVTRCLCSPDCLQHRFAIIERSSPCNMRSGSQPTIC